MLSIELILDHLAASALCASVLALFGWLAYGPAERRAARVVRRR
jgi:hypothetical protein